MVKDLKTDHKARPSTSNKVKILRSDLENIIRDQDNGWDIRFRPPFPRKLYKYVNSEHASAVQDGSIKIGTIRGYADLENGRSDDAEGTSAVYPTRISLQRGEGQEIRRGMRDLGFYGDGPIEIQSNNNNIKFSAVTPNYLCYCLSLTPRSRSLLKARDQAVFEIIHFDRFLLRLLTKLQVDTAWVGAVEYSSRTFTRFDGPESRAPSAWRKPYRRESDGYRYDKEREYRILMMPQESVSTDPYGPDPLLGQFFRMI